VLAESPLRAQVSSLDALLALPYFELMSYFGHSSMHPGGLEATVHVLQAAELGAGDNVLEVGCGTGASTHLLLEVGLTVHVAEPNPFLLESTLRNCREFAGKAPHSYLTDAEHLAGVRDHSMQLVMFEAVLGFVRNREAAIVQCKRVLKPFVGRLAIVDFFYDREPPAELRRALARVVGQEVDVLREHDWRDLLRGFRPVIWESVTLSPIAAPTTDAIRDALRRGKALPDAERLSEADLERVAARLHANTEVFEWNRSYLSGNRIVARVPYA
jgi:SAM-dependent methyltransferase